MRQLPTFCGLRWLSVCGTLVCRLGLTWRSTRTRKSSAPLNFSVSLVGKSALFKPLNIQTAFTFSGALFVGKSSFFVSLA